MHPPSQRRPRAARLTRLSILAVGAVIASSLLGAPLANADKVLVDNKITVPGASGAEFTADGSRAYVTGVAGGDHHLTVIDTSNHSIAATIPMPSSSADLAISPDGKHAYVSTLTTGLLVVVDTVTNQVVTSINLGGVTYGVAVSPDNKRVYVGNNNGTVSEIDATTNLLIQTVTMPGTVMSVQVSPDGEILYAGNIGSGTIEVLDAATMQILRSVQAPQVERFAVTADGKRAYTVGPGRNFRSIEMDTGEATTFVAGNQFTKTFDVDITPDGARAYVTAEPGNRFVHVVDIASNTVIQTLTMANTPFYISISPTGALAYVSSHESGFVTPIAIEVAPTVSGEAPKGVVGQPYSHQLTVSGHPAATVTTTGALPPGLALSAAGLLSGTPTQAGIFPFTVKAANGIEPDAEFDVTVEITLAPPNPDTGGDCHSGLFGSLGSLGSTGSIGSAGSQGSAGSHSSAGSLC